MGKSASVCSSLLLSPDNDFAGKDHVTLKLIYFSESQAWDSVSITNNGLKQLIISIHIWCIFFISCRLLRQMKWENQPLTCENWYIEKCLTNRFWTLSSCIFKPWWVASFLSSWKYIRIGVYYYHIIFPRMYLSLFKKCSW